MKRPPDIQHILQLISSLIVPMYYIHRDIVPPKRSPLRENDAEHSWALALLACALAPQINPKLDIGKVAQFAIVHDVVEVYSGDVSAMDSQAANSSERKIREAAALERIQSDFSYMPWIAETIKEYESFSSEEACFVYALDKFMPVAYDYLDGGEYARHCHTTREAYQYHMIPHREKAQRHPVVGRYYDEVRTLLDAQPDHFYDPENVV